MNGTLYGVGVGPGDPELMTVKAWRLISTARVISYLAANGGESTALEIARPFLPQQFEAIAMDMPMRVEREFAQPIYDEGARRIAATLKTGADVVFLCEGDPFFYGSFMYIHERISKEFHSVAVPGVTSITAAAAVTGMPLVERDEMLKVLPATMSAETLRAELQFASSTAIIKVGRHFEKVKNILAELGLDGTAISYATRPNETQRKVGEIEEDTLPYFTTIIVRRR